MTVAAPAFPWISHLPQIPRWIRNPIHTMGRLFNAGGWVRQAFGGVFAANSPGNCCCAGCPVTAWATGQDITPTAAPISPCGTSPSDPCGPGGSLSVANWGIDNQYFYTAGPGATGQNAVLTCNYASLVICSSRPCDATTIADITDTGCVGDSDNTLREFTTHVTVGGGCDLSTLIVWTTVCVDNCLMQVTCNGVPTNVCYGAGLGPILIGPNCTVPDPCTSIPPCDDGDSKQYCAGFSNGVFLTQATGLVRGVNTIVFTISQLGIPGPFNPYNLSVSPWTACGG